MLRASAASNVRRPLQCAGLDALEHLTGGRRHHCRPAPARLSPKQTIEKPIDRSIAAAARQLSPVAPGEQIGRSVDVKQLGVIAILSTESMIP